MKRIRTISKVDTANGYIHMLQIDDPFGNAVTLMAENNTWEYSCYNRYFRSEIFTDKKKAETHFKESANLADLYNLTGIR